MLKGSAKYSFVLFVLLCGVLICASGCRDDKEAGGSVTEKEVDTRPIGAKVYVSRDTMTVADLLGMKLEAIAKSGYEVVSFPEIEKSIGEFEVYEEKSEKKRLGKDGELIVSKEYRLSILKLGRYELGEMKFEFADVNEPDKKYEVFTDPIEIEVVSLLADVNDANGIELAAIEGVLEEPGGYARVWWSASAIVAVIGAGWWYIKRKRERLLNMRVMRSAYEIAYGRLRDLEADELVESKKVKEFYERISGIMRYYIEDRFEVRAPERTTEEFLAEAKSSAAMREDDKRYLAEFLGECDLVKFAKHEPIDDDMRRTFSKAENFIEQSRDFERTIDVTGEVKEGGNG